MNTTALQAWWAQRPLREKALIVVVGLGAFAAAADFALTAPLEQKLRREKGALSALQERLARAPGAAAPNAGQDSALRQQEAALRQRLQAAQAEAKDLRSHLGDAAALPDTLRAVTATVGGLQLVALDLSGTPEATAPGTAETNASAHPNANVGTLALPRLYRLPVTLKVSGSYSELHTLLTQFERHAQALRWTQLQLDATDWPAIQLTLKAHVLSPSPRWGAAS